MSQPSVKRNVAVNVIGGFWTLILNFLVIPVQIRILGAEAYGLIGFVATLQLILSVFDFGLTYSVIRGIAGDQSPDRSASRALVQTAITIYNIIGLIFGIVIFLNAGWIAEKWLNLQALPSGLIVSALRVMGISVVANWLLGLAVAILTGLQRLEVVNGLRIATRTLIQIGGIIVLLLGGNLQSFVVWIAISSTFTLLVHVGYCIRLFKGLRLTPFWSFPAIKKISHFSLGMSLTSIFGTVYTQTDSVLISKFLPLTLLGYYNVAFALTLGTATVQQFISAATLPTLVADYSSGQISTFRVRYRKYVQLLVYIVGLPTFIFMFFGYEFLRVWASPETAQGGAQALTLLSFGFFLNTLAAGCYTLSIATGRTRVLVIVNFAGLVIYVPMLYLLVSQYQLSGAALAWVLVNIYYLAFLLPFGQFRVIKVSSWYWLARNFLPYLLLGGIFVLGSFVVSYAQLGGTVFVWVVCAFSALSYLIIGFFMLDSSLRQAVWHSGRQIFMNFQRQRKHNIEAS